jgi:protease IV
MEGKKPNLFVRLVRGTWRAVDLSRRAAVNLLFVVLVVLLVAALLGDRPNLPDKAALVVAPEGVLVEQLSAHPFEEVLTNPSLREGHETLVRDLTDAIDAAKDDDHIQALFLDLDDLGGGGLSKLQDVRAAIAAFRKSGKKVIAASDSYGRDSYHLAVAADEVYLHPEGELLVEGYGIWQPYFKAGLDKYQIDWHVFRVGEYKSAVEPFLRNDASPEAREEYLDVLGDLWGTYLADVAAARKLTPAAARDALDGLVDRIPATGGDAARAAREARLVDRLAPRDEVDRRLVQLVGEDEDEHTFHQVTVDDYLKIKRLRPELPRAGDVVGVVVAAGEILDGEQDAGRIGGDSTAALIRDARHDDDVKAIVLRVDSPGGSAFASEVIRRELVLARKQGKPVVVSMGSLAASGGYWISTASDEIWAAPTTITGSIGIFGMFPTFDKPLAEHLGTRVDGVGTNWLSGAFRPDRPLDPKAGELIQRLINDGYNDFLKRVAEARKKTPAEIDRIARGRVWSGADAKRLGLVDQLGTLDGAIAAAAKRAKLEGKPRVVFLEKELSWDEKLARDLFESAAPLLGRAPAARGWSLAARAREVQRDLARLAVWNDPRGIYAHCLCEAR